MNLRRFSWFGAPTLLVAVSALLTGQSEPGSEAVQDLLQGRFSWQASQPIAEPVDRAGDHYYSIKDPTIVRHGGRWHLFCTIRGQKRSHQIEYLSFADWGDLPKAERQMMTLSDGYYCAPQVFYFRPHKKWYLIYQVVDESRKPALQPAYSTTTDISDPSSWTKPALLFAENPANVKMWIDFWVISDEQKSYLFFTSLDGRMWRADTSLSDFPFGWGQPQVVLEGDIYEASHTYRLKGLKQYLTIVEAQADKRRYFKAYIAERLDGAWKPIADTLDRPFAAPGNVRFADDRWTDSISHGEFIRDGYDETLTVDPARLEVIFQGVTDVDKEGKKYGEIPWRLGLLRPVR